MKKIIPFILGIFSFLMLIGSDLIYQNLYYERSIRSLEQCHERSDQTDVCGMLADTAISAYSSATANHLVTYMVIFLLFGLLTLRVESLEKRLKEVQKQTNV